MSLDTSHSDKTLTAGESVLSAIGAALLIGTEMLGAGVALAWALGGLLGLGPTVTYIVMGVVAVPGLYACIQLTRRIIKVEARLRQMVARS